MSGIWQFLLQLGSNHPDKQNNYKWFVIVNLPQRTAVKALNKASLQKTLISVQSFVLLFSFFNRTCHIPIPQRLHTHRWMKTNKTFPKSSRSPLAQAVSLSRQGTLSERKEGGVTVSGQTWRGGGVVVVV